MRRLLALLLCVVCLFTLCACSSGDIDKARIAGYEEGKNAGYKEGYQDGYKKGKEDGSNYWSTSTVWNTPKPTKTPNSSGADYVLNTNTKKFHYPWCSSVDDMAEHNKKYYTGTRQEVIDMGFVPCKRCNP